MIIFPVTTVGEFIPSKLRPVDSGQHISIKVTDTEELREVFSCEMYTSGNLYCPRMLSLNPSRDYYRSQEQRAELHSRLKSIHVSDGLHIKENLNHMVKHAVLAHNPSLVELSVHITYSLTKEYKCVGSEVHL